MPVVWTNPDIIYLWFMFSHVPAKEVSPKLVTQLPHFNRTQNRTQNPFDLKIDTDARVQTAVSKGVRPVISVEMNLCMCSVLCKGGEISSSNVWIKYIICRYQRGSYKFSPKCFSYDCSFAYIQYQNNQLHLQLTYYWKTTEIKYGDKECYCHKFWVNLETWISLAHSSEVLWTKLHYRNIWNQYLKRLWPYSQNPDNPSLE